MNESILEQEKSGLLRSIPAKHTPGPWSNNGGQIEAPAVGKYRDYCVVATVGQVNEQRPIDTANARLIAAAPDLLAACKAALARLERLDDDGTGEHSPAYLQAKAAIAKAEGRAN